MPRVDTITSCIMVPILHKGPFHPASQPDTHSPVTWSQDMSSKQLPHTPVQLLPYVSFEHSMYTYRNTMYSYG